MCVCMIFLKQGVKLIVLLIPQAPECWDSRPVPPYTAQNSFLQGTGTEHCLISHPCLIEGVS